MPAKLLNRRILACCLAAAMLPAVAQAQFGLPSGAPPPTSDDPPRDAPTKSGSGGADKQRPHTPVLTEAQKRCRVENRCKLDASPCPPCQ